MPYNPNALPGDPDFDWSQYNQWSASGKDPVAQAKDTLAKTAPTAERLNLISSGEQRSSLEPAEGAASRSIADTGYDVMSGLARSPLDFISNLPNLVNPKAYVRTAQTLAHPVDLFNYLGANPKEAGSLMGQIALGEVAPGMAKTAIAKGPEAIESVGSKIAGAGSKLAGGTVGGFSLPGAGLWEALLRSDPKGLALAATPYAIQGVGKLTEATGKGLGAIRDFFSSSAGTVDPYMPNVSGYTGEAPPQVKPKMGGIPYAEPTPYVPSPGSTPKETTAEVMRDQKNLERLMKWRDAQEKAKQGAATGEPIVTASDKLPGEVTQPMSDAEYFSLTGHQRGQFDFTQYGKPEPGGSTLELLQAAEKARDAQNLQNVQAWSSGRSQEVPRMREEGLGPRPEAPTPGELSPLDAAARRAQSNQQMSALMEALKPSSPTGPQLAGPQTPESVAAAQTAAETERQPYLKEKSARQARKQMKIVRPGAQAAQPDWVQQQMDAIEALRKLQNPQG